VADAFGAYIPRPTTSSGSFGKSVVDEESKDGTRVCDDKDVEERHLKDMSENLGRCSEALYGNIRSSKFGSLVTPSK
jgi:hypothetical protein